MQRLASGQYKSSDHPDFLPNLSPAEMFQAGIFGGSYFRDITLDGKQYHRNAWKEFVSYGFFDGLDISTQVSSPDYIESRNRYKVKCGQGLDVWIDKGWILKEFDTHGWVHWYCRYFLGRRCDDDERQISRWKKCAGEKGRWRRNLIAKCVKAGKPWDDESVSPVVRQTLLHWAYQLTEKDYHQYKKMIEKGHRTSFIPQNEMKHVVKVHDDNEEHTEQNKEDMRRKRVQQQNQERESRARKRSRPND